jgi:hypothetical protein
MIRDLDSSSLNWRRARAPRIWREALLVCSTLCFSTMASGCSNSQTVTTADGVAVVIGSSSGESMDAVATGQLGRIDGCLGISSSGGDLVVIWPHGTKVDARDQLTIRMPGGIEITEGDSVSVAGGGVETPSDLPKACSSASVWLANSSQ